MLKKMANGVTSVITRVKILDTAQTDGGGLTGLTFETSGLIISTIADVEATATAYTVAAGKIETIATLGTFAAPTATKCRFKEVDATNHPGLYEIQIADARWAVSGAKSVVITINGAANMAQTDALIDLSDVKIDSVAANVLTASALATDAVTEIVTGMLNQDLTTVTGTPAAMSFMTALCFLAGHFSIDSDTGVCTIFAPDKTTPLAKTTLTGSAGASPVIASSGAVTP